MTRNELAEVLTAQLLGISLTNEENVHYSVDGDNVLVRVKLLILIAGITEENIKELGEMIFELKRRLP